MKVFCVGEEWSGSNSSGIFHALGRLGCVISITNELRYVSVQAKSTLTKIFNRAVRSFQIDDFNDQLRIVSQSFKPDLILVYKGTFVKPSFLYEWKKLGVPIVLFFPDISFLVHGKLIPSCIHLYDHIFTTKTFAAADLWHNFKYDEANVTFIPHGFDPMIHRPIEGVSEESFNCEASFVGSHTLHKERYLWTLKTYLPELELKIWGQGWRAMKSPLLERSIQHVAVYGDLYVLALQSSKVNIALLHEKVSGASRSDQITSRTFHIPGSGGFMLHQRTEEVLHYFEEGNEMACFSSQEELAEKVSFYLTNSSERERIRKNGFKRAMRDHSMDARASEMLKVLKSKGLIK